jgi:RHS repeat-associated protein
MKKFYFIFLLSCARVLANIDVDARVIVDDKPHIINNCVNAISGDFFYSKLDHVIQGAEPIVLSHSYVSGNTLRKYGGWTLFAHLKLIWYPGEYGSHYVRVSEPSGLTLTYKFREYAEDKSLIFKPKIDETTPGFINSSSRVISARTNYKNNYIELDAKKKGAKVFAADGSVRIYGSKKHEDGYTTYKLTEEIRPNGNRIIYEYDENDLLTKIETKNPSKTKTYANVILYNYEKKKDVFDIKTRVNETKTLKHIFGRSKKDWNKYEHLVKVDNGPERLEKFYYELGYKEGTWPFKGKKKNKSRGHFVNEIEYSSKKILGVDYYRPGENFLSTGEMIDIEDAKEDTRNEKVHTIKEPVGESGELVPTYTLQYESLKKKQNGYNKSGYTSVVDNNGNETVYHYSKNLRLEKVEYFKNQKSGKVLHAKEKFIWGEGKDATNLKIKIFEDPTNRTSFAKEYIYDEKGNVIEEITFANFSGKTPSIIKLQDGKIVEGNLEKVCVKYKYSENNLPIEKEEENGIKIKYFYKHNTDLVTAKYIIDNENIIKREYTYYNEDNIVTKIVVDDGSTDKDNDLANVTNRIIKYIHLRDDYPAINLPDYIEEKYLDISKGCEILLKKQKFHYNQDSLLIKKDFYDANNAYKYSVKFKYDDQNQIIEKTDPQGLISKFKYDPSGNIIFSKDSSDSSAHYFKYDTANRLTQKEEVSAEGFCHKTNFFYDKYHNKIKEIDFQGNVTKYSYDRFGNCIEKKLPYVENNNSQNLESFSEQYSYDALSRKIYKNDTNGAITETEFNAFGKPTKTIYPDGGVERFSYNLEGTLKEAINQEGTVTRYSYDNLNQMLLKSILDSNNNILLSEEKTYKGFKLITSIDAGNNVTRYFYDGANRKAKQEIIAANASLIKKTSFFYDSLGRQNRTENFCNKKILTYLKEYDLLDKIICEKEFDENQTLLSKKEFTYDPHGSKTSSTIYVNNEPSTTNYFYDGFKRLIKIIEPKSNHTKFIYDDFHLNDHNQKVLKKTTSLHNGVKIIEIFNPFSNLDSLEKTDPDGNTILKEKNYYDAKGNISYKIHDVISNGKKVDTISNSWNFNLNNKLETFVEAKNSKDEKTTKHFYTTCNLLRETIKPDGVKIYKTYNRLGHLKSLKTSDGSIDYFYEHDKLGNLKKLTDNISQTSIDRKLDSLGQVLEEILPNSFSLKYSYDEFGRILETIFPDGSTIQRSYGAKHLEKVTKLDPTGYAIYKHSYLKYDLASNLLLEQMPNSIEREYSYDNANNLLSIRSAYLKNDATYDSTNRITSISFNNKNPYTYKYDHLNQITFEKSTIKKSYTNDSLFNRRMVDEKEYEINKLNQIISIDKTFFKYDKNGNPVYKTSFGKEIIYKYDALDRLIEIEDKKVCKTFYEYDGLHRRISKTVFKYLDHEYQLDKKTNFIFENQNEIGAFDENGKIFQLRTIGNSQTAEIASAIVFELDSKYYIPIYDISSNVAALISADDNKVCINYRYSVFGEEEILDRYTNPLSSSPINNPWRFSSKRLDEESGLTFFGRRYYDQELGRFLTPDPKGYTDSQNLYAYLLNDPISKIDLYGLFSFPGFAVGINIPLGGGTSPSGGSALPNYSYNAPMSMVTTPLANSILEFKESSKTYDLGRPALPKGGEIGFINGMCNKKKDALQNARMLSDLSGGYNIKLTHNASHGFLGDLVESAYNKAGGSTTPSKLLVAQWKTFFYFNKELKYLQICHSQGAIHVRNALKMLTSSERDRIKVVAIGPGAYVSRDLCPDSSHYVSNRDPIPILDYKNMMTANITPLKPHPDAHFIDHNFDSPTFTHSLKYHISSYIKNPQR